jgi:hypothetical protein
MISLDGRAIDAGELILTARWVYAQDDATLLASMREMARLANDPDLYTAKMSWPGPIFTSIEAFYTYKQQVEIVNAESPLPIKQQLMRQRRQEFQHQRAALQLALIARDGYVCSITDCGVIEGLTIDHRFPLSKGGSDALENLRWLCQSHNSAKGDRYSHK